MIRVLHGDCLIELPKLSAVGERFHACVCDPPYGLEFMGKEWDSFGRTRDYKPRSDEGYGDKGVLPGYGRGGTSDQRETYRRKSNHNYQEWCEAWAREVYAVLLPGAHLLAFGGTRTYHRLVCAIEDAGFEIRDTKAWLYGSGFPKSLDVSKAIDKAAGVERDVIDRVRVKSGGTEHINRSNAAVHDYRPDGYQKGENVLDVTTPATPEAAAWQGWGTALKPAMELIVVARKPLSERTVAANVLKHGCGALNIDACRVPTSEGQIERGDEPTAGQRYTELGGTNFAATPGARRGRPHRVSHSDPGNGIYGEGIHGSHADGETTLGRWPANVVHDGSEEVLAAFPKEAGGGYSNQGSGRQTGAWVEGSGLKNRPGVEFGFGDSGSAARFFYQAKADRGDRADSKHPTIKPVDLIRWLVTLVCPPGGHVLDPFAGSGTTGEACMLAGFDCTLIEREAQHAADIRHRIKRWSGLDAPLFAEPESA